MPPPPSIYQTPPSIAISICNRPPSLPTLYPPAPFASQRHRALQYLNALSLIHSNDNKHFYGAFWHTADFGCVSRQFVPFPSRHRFLTIFLVDFRSVKGCMYAVLCVLCGERQHHHHHQPQHTNHDMLVHAKERCVDKVKFLLLKSLFRFVWIEHWFIVFIRAWATGTVALYWFIHTRVFVYHIWNSISVVADGKHGRIQILIWCWQSFGSTFVLRTKRNGSYGISSPDPPSPTWTKWRWKDD